MNLIATKIIPCKRGGEHWVIVPGDVFERIAIVNGKVLVKHRGMLLEIEVNDYDGQKIFMEGERHEV